MLLEKSFSYLITSEFYSVQHKSCKQRSGKYAEIKTLQLSFALSSNGRRGYHLSFELKKQIEK